MLWLSGSQLFPELAERCRQALEGVGVQTASVTQLAAGECVPDRIFKGIDLAKGAIILLASGWTNNIAPVELQPIVAHCRAGGHLWILDVESAIDPAELQQVPQQQTYRLPRDGKRFSHLSRPKQDEVVEELCRSVAARFDLPAPRDAQYRQLQGYRASEKRNLETVPLKGFFTARHPAAARTFRFDDLFIPPRLELLRLPTDIETQYQQLVAKIKNDRLKPQERWDLENQYNILVARLKIGQTYSLDEALKHFPQMMLLGKPGSGKSSILHHLALKAHGTDAQLAVQIKLYKIAEKAQSSESLWPQVLLKVRAEHKAAIAQAVDEWVHQGRGLILLDGVDEVKMEHRQKLLRAVERMLLEKPQLRCVVTSRVATDCWLNHSIPHLQVADLTQSDIASFVHKHNRCEDQATAERRSERFLKSLAERGELYALATNPLSLRLLCLLDNGQEGLPRELVELYERAVRTLLETWPANRVARKVHVSTDALRHALSSAAAWMHQQGHRQATHADLLQQLAIALPRNKAKTAEQLATHCLDVATTHSGVLIEASPEIFEFLHLTFTEYLAAEHYIRMEGLAQLAEQRADTRYLQVIRFAAGILVRVKPAPDTAAKFIRQLMTEAPGSSARVRHPHLSVAAACLGDGHGLSPDLVDEVLGAVLRAATIPLESSTETAQNTLIALRVGASDSCVAACAALVHHPLVSLRRAVAQWLADYASGQPEGRELYLQLLSDTDDMVAGYAALGLVRARAVPEKRLFRMVIGLAACIDPTIGAADEVEGALFREPGLLAQAEKLYHGDDARWHGKAARLLCLLRPDDRALIATLLDKDGHAGKYALQRAARKSQSTAHYLVENYLQDEDPRSSQRPTVEAVLGSVFADTPAVRQRLLIHFGKPLPEDDRHSHAADPEWARTKAASSFLHEVVKLGGQEDRQPIRTALLNDLRALLPTADGDLCRRIAELAKAAGATPEWLSYALERCMVTGGAFRVWAISTAYHNKLYSLAVTGTLARASDPRCFDAAVLDIRKRLRRGSVNRDILTALTQTADAPHASDVLLLCQVTMGQQSVESLYSLLTEPSEHRPVALRYWAAGEIALQARREKKQPPRHLLGAVFALANADWPEPVDRRAGLPETHRPPSWLPKHDSFPESITWVEGVEFPDSVADTKTAVGLIRQFLRWSQRLAADGVELRWSLLDRHRVLLLDALAKHIELLDGLLADLDSLERPPREVAEWLLGQILQFERPHSRDQDRHGSTPGAAGTAIQVIHERICHVLAHASPSLRRQLIEFLCDHGLGGAYLHAQLASFLSAENDFSVRWWAFVLLHSADAIVNAAGQDVFCTALASENYALRLDAVEYSIPWRLSSATYTDSLYQLLDSSNSPYVRIEAAALWLRILGADRAIVIPTLVDLLSNLESTERWNVHRVSMALRHITGPSPEGQPIPARGSEFEPHDEEDGLGPWSAALLVELRGHEEELRAAAGTWLDDLPSNVSGSRAGKARRHWAFLLLEHVGVGAVGPSVDRALVGMLQEEQRHPVQLLHWVRRFRRVTQPILERLLPYMLRAENAFGQEVQTWILELILDSSGARDNFNGALRATVTRPRSSPWQYGWSLPESLFRFSLMDEEGARLFAAVAAHNPWCYAPEEIRGYSPTANPLIRKHLIEALDQFPLYECLLLVDWLVPISDLTREDGSTTEPPPTDVMAVLRTLLGHPDLWMRYEVAERLCLLGHKDAAVMHALRSCLDAPRDWVGPWHGDDLRRKAAKVLWQFDAISAPEILDTLLPMLALPQPLSSMDSTIEVLGTIEACRGPMLEVMARVLTDIPTSRLEGWRSLLLLFRFGFPEEKRLPLVLRYLAEFWAPGQTFIKELRALLPGIDVGPALAGVISAGQESAAARYGRLRVGPLGGAVELAELPSWPSALLRQFAEAVNCAEDVLNDLEERGASLAETRTVDLLEPLLHHRAGEGSLARLVRYACLFRFGKLLGITPEQLPYEMRG